MRSKCNVLLQIIFFSSYWKNSYPFIDQYTDKTFLPCYIHLSHGGYCTAIGFNGVDSIFITACFHIAAQFQLITMRFQKVFTEVAQRGHLTKEENQRWRQVLIEAMEDQIKLFELIDLFIKVFMLIILMHFVSVAVIIGIGSIDFLMVLIGSKFEFYIYMMMHD